MSQSSHLLQRAKAFLIPAASLLAMVIGWWFWQTIVQGTDRPRFDLIGPAASIGIIGAGVAGLAASGMALAGKSVLADRIGTGALKVAGVCLIAIVINTAITVGRNQEFETLGGIWQSFVDFNRVQIGPVRISITTTLSIILIALAIGGTFTGRKDKNGK